MLFYIKKTSCTRS